MADIKSVALRAGVSISTVSNVINKTKPVSPELTKKVEEAISELHYHVNQVARGLKSRRTNQIGVVLSSLNRIFFNSIVQGIEDRTMKYGYSLNVFDASDDLKKEKECISLLEHSWVDGVILASCVDSGLKENQDYLKLLGDLGKRQNQHIPVVSLERVLDENCMSSVLVDNRLAAFKAVTHLIEMGHKSIAHIAAPFSITMGRQRFEGYKDALKANHIEFCRDIVVEGDYSPMSGYNVMRNFLLHGKNIDAVFAGNDQMGIGAIKAIREMGLHIPEDIAVIGFDNLFPSSIITPSLSSVNVPRFRMGSEAVEILHHEINNPEEKKKIIQLDTQLVVRQSTDLHGDNTWDLYGW